jgi:serine/threonine protein kinase
MGTAFRAWDVKLERWVALKTVRAAAGMANFWNEDLVRRLVVEATLPARFNHPHVVTVHDVHDAADAAYVIMELVDGISLQELLRNGGRLTVEHAVPLLAAVASARPAAQAIDLMHRHVKPHNVLLGQNGAIKLTDFGIAHFVSSQMRNATFGTPGYLPPEVLRGEPEHRGGPLRLGRGGVPLPDRAIRVPGEEPPGDPAEHAQYEASSPAGRGDRGVAGDRSHRGRLAPPGARPTDRRRAAPRG